MNRKKIKAGPGKQWVEGKDFRLAKEIKYIQHQAAKHDGRFVTIGPLVFIEAGTIALIVALVTIAWQSLKAALSNPIRSLRSE